jgi:hypothetical protein
LRERAVFEGWHGERRIVEGQFAVWCDEIPADARTDWPLGPCIMPGWFGLYREHLFWESKHGPFPFATGATPEEAKSKASGFFTSQVSPWVTAP